MDECATNKNSAVNMLNGSIIKALNSLALPITVTSLATMAYNLVDMMWIGRLGAESSAAVGTAGMLLWFFDGVMLLARVGGQVYTANSIGAENMQAARNYARSALQLAVFLGAISSLIIFSIAPFYISFFRLDNPLTVSKALSYLRIFAAGTILSYLIRVYTGLATAVGNTKISLYITVSGLLINFILDPVFIFTFNLGVNGAALASVISQLICVVSFYLVLRKTEIFYKMRYFSRFDFEAWRKIIVLSLPAMFQTFFLSGIAIVIGRMVSSFGDTSIAVQKVGANIESISWMTADGFSMAVNAFIAQNYGAKQYRRAKKGYFTALAIISALGIFTTLLLYFQGQNIFSIFIHEAELQTPGYNYLRILAFSQFFMCLEILTYEAFLAYAKSFLPSLITISLTLARIPMALLLSTWAGFGINGIWWALSISSILKGCLLFTAFMFFLYRSDRLRQTEIQS